MPRPRSGRAAVFCGTSLAPVRPGDTATTEVEVISIKETSKSDRGVIVFREHLVNQHGDTVYPSDKTALLRRALPPKAP